MSAPTIAAATLLLSSCVTSSLLAAPASTQDQPRSGGTISLYAENDAFADTDNHYTSGLKIGWSSPDLSKFSDSPYSSSFLPILDRLPYINEPAFQKNLVLAVGQNIYTPNNTKIAAPIPDDRPYAGWLYLGVGVVWKNATVRNSVVFDVGVVGSWSFAEETQRLAHDLLGGGHSLGWDNQLHNELGFVGTYERTWRWPKHERRSGLNWEILPHLGLAVGNVATYANLGTEIRAGVNLPDNFGTSAISPSTVTSTPVDGILSAERPWFDLGVHVFARVDGRAVANNIFLDGNTFGGSPSVERNILVADLSVGLAVNYKNTELAFALVYRTEEFRGEDSGQIFGTVSINITYELAPPVARSPI